ncbi:hypothetical protein RN053_03150 [Pantoea dispersa]|uniref:hypothetical protein n=1 Tax=Pantoea dispersa TaxID=59814 RepID=UPI0028DFF338|nr:hypothetical protein [Pantoea dispersa]MDT8849472.1 hypothetical protein [Pantoea dispersa]
MIRLNIGGTSHDLSVEDAKQLALAIAAEVDMPGQPQRFRGTGIAFSIERSTAPADPQSSSRAGITLTNC